MRISTRGRYALRFMIDLARHYNDGLVPLKAVSEREAISEKYLEQIVGALGHQGLLHSARGPQGGYALAKPARDYTVYEILLATETDMAPVACLAPNAEECSMRGTCPTIELWQGLEKVVADYLDSVTLEELAKGTMQGAQCMMI